MCALYQQGTNESCATPMIAQCPSQCIHVKNGETEPCPNGRHRGTSFTKLAIMCGSHGDPEYECQFEEADCPYKGHTVRPRRAEAEEMDASL
eukprot:6198698-Prymnesium_polylepis.1